MTQASNIKIEMDELKTLHAAERKKDSKALRAVTEMYNELFRDTQNTREKK